MKWRLKVRDNAVLIVDEDRNLIADFWPDSAEDFGLPEYHDAIINARACINAHNAKELEDPSDPCTCTDPSHIHPERF